MKIVLILIVLLSGNLYAQKDSLFSETGIASFYAKRFEGRRCASGEIFHQDSLTAAHKRLPFGTLVRVTNLNNDSSVVLRINDRLPHSSRRCIDVTRSAAKRLDFIRTGLTKVRVEELTTGPN